METNEWRLTLVIIIVHALNRYPKRVLRLLIHIHILFWSWKLLSRYHSNICMYGKQWHQMSRHIWQSHTIDISYWYYRIMHTTTHILAQWTEIFIKTASFFVCQEQEQLSKVLICIYWTFSIGMSCKVKYLQRVPQSSARTRSKVREHVRI